jgi:VanZ family protein
MPIERLFRLLFWSVLVFAFVMAILPQPPALPGDPGDKLLHMLAFFVLGGLATFAYPRLRLLTIFVGLAVFGGVIEIVQAIPELGREASWLDWLADVSALGFVLMMAGVIRFVWRRRAVAAR